MAVQEAPKHGIDPTITIPPFTMPLISPSALLQAYLSQTPPIRPSKRSPTQTRPISLNVGSLTHCNGSSVVRVGESTIVCGIRAEILPVSDIPHYRAAKNTYAQANSHEEQELVDDHKSYEAITLNNLLVPNLELSTNAHPSFPANVTPTITAQSISQRILSLLHTSRLVRSSDLEIRHTSESAASDLLDPDDPAYVEPERNVLKAYWVLYIDCVCLSYGGEGNVFDTAVMAIIAALKDVKLPLARWDEDSKKVLCSPDMKLARGLKLDGLPTPLSFGVFVSDPRLDFVARPEKVNGVETSQSEKKDTPEGVVMVDLDAFEDDVCEEKGCVVVDVYSGKVVVRRIEKVGGKGVLGVERMKELTSLAETRWSEWKGVLDAAVQGNG